VSNVGYPLESLVLNVQGQPFVKGRPLNTAENKRKKGKGDGIISEDDENPAPI